MKSKQVLSIEQMKQLQKLGLNTTGASMCWIKTPTGRDLAFNDEWTGRRESFLYPVPAYTLQDVLEALPRFVTYQNMTYDLLINMEQYVMEYFRESDIDTLVGVKFENTSLIDAAYSMLCWCIENGHVNTKN